MLALLASASGFVAAPARLAVRPARAPVVLRAEQDSAAAAVATLAAAVISFSAGVTEVSAAPAFDQTPATSTLLALQTTDWTAADFDWDSIGKPKPPPAPGHFSRTA